MTEIVIENKGDIDKCKTIVESLKSAAQLTLPNLYNQNKSKETWKEDTDLNSLLKQRNITNHGSDEYKRLTKLIKSRVRYLRNEKFKVEANEINDYASRGEVE